MVLQVVYLFIGLAVLTAGAEALVRGASSFARHLGLTPLVVGLTVVAFGTSAPEMVVSVGGAIKGHGDIAVGNVVGSNIFNTGCILGLAALIAPIRIKMSLIKMDAPLILLISLWGAYLVTRGTVTRGAGLFLLVVLAVYTCASIYVARRQSSSDIEEEFREAVPLLKGSTGKDIVFILLGLACLIGGSKIFIGATLLIARGIGISEAAIALTIVAAGTSMPELATSVMAAFRGHGDIAVGNVLGSNLFNVLGILGLSAVVQPFDAPGIQLYDLGVMVLFAGVLIPLCWTGKMLHRWEGFLLLSLYSGYLVTLLMKGL